jgi:hypothetical protein
MYYIFFPKTIYHILWWSIYYIFFLEVYTTCCDGVNTIFFAEKYIPHFVMEYILHFLQRSIYHILWWSTIYFILCNGVYTFFWWSVYYIPLYLEWSIYCFFYKSDQTYTAQKNRRVYCIHRFVHGQYISFSDEVEHMGYIDPQDRHICC